MRIFNFFMCGMPSKLINTAKDKNNSTEHKNSGSGDWELDLDSTSSSPSCLFCYHGQVTNPASIGLMIMLLSLSVMRIKGDNASEVLGTARAPGKYSISGSF